MLHPTFHRYLVYFLAEEYCSRQLMEKLAKSIMKHMSHIGEKVAHSISMFTLLSISIVSGKPIVFIFKRFQILLNTAITKFFYRLTQL